MKKLYVKTTILKKNYKRDENSEITIETFLLDIDQKVHAQHHIKKILFFPL